MVRYFCIAFLIFGTIGVVAGLIQRSEIDDPEAVKATILSNLGTPTRVPKSEPLEISYTCHSKQFYVFSDETGDVRPKALEAVPPHPKSSRKLADLFRQSNAMVLVAVGTNLDRVTALGLLTKDPASVTTKEKIGFAVGAVTGYLIGYLLTSRDIPPCDSPVVLQQLDNKDNWRGLLHEKLQNSLNSYFIVLNDGPIPLASATRELRRAVLLNVDHNESLEPLLYMLDHFDALYAKAENQQSKLGSSDLYDAQQWERNLLWELDSQPAILHEAFPNNRRLWVTNRDDLNLAGWLVFLFPHIFLFTPLRLTVALGIALIVVAYYMRRIWRRI